MSVPRGDGRLSGEQVRCSKLLQPCSWEPRSRCFPVCAYEPQHPQAPQSPPWKWAPSEGGSSPAASCTPGVGPWGPASIVDRKSHFPSPLPPHSPAKCHHVAPIRRASPGLGVHTTGHTDPFQTRVMSTRASECARTHSRSRGFHKQGALGHPGVVSLYPGPLLLSPWGLRGVRLTATLRQTSSFQTPRP